MKKEQREFILKVCRREGTEGGRSKRELKSKRFLAANDNISTIQQRQLSLAQTKISQTSSIDWAIESAPLSMTFTPLNRSSEELV